METKRNKRPERIDEQSDAPVLPEEVSEVETKNRQEDEDSNP